MLAESMTIAHKELRPGITVVEITGAITMGQDCDRLGKEFDDLLAQKTTRIILDLSRVHRVDSSGIGRIVLCFSKLKKQGGQLRIAGATGMVANVLKMTTVDKILGVYSTPDDAADGL